MPLPYLRVFQAERKLGELLKESYQPGRGSLPDEVSYNQSSRWQQAAELPEEDFEQHLIDVHTQGETLTSECN